MLESVKQVKSLHFVGIAGSGMCPLAIIAKSKGYQVTGSDLSRGKNRDILDENGIMVYPHHDEQNAIHADALVISSAIKNDNPELRWANANKLPVYHRSDLLAKISDTYHLVTVAGTNGNTTTSAILSYLLDIHIQDPLSVVGGHMHHFDASWHLGKGPHFIAEADESDGSFLKYQPTTSLLNNIDKDHLDHYGNFDRVKSAFNQYLNNTKPNGTTVISVDDEASYEAYKAYKGKKISFGTKRASDFQASDIKVDGQFVNFQLKHKEQNYACRLKSIGPHNVANAVAAIATSFSLGLPIQKSADALKSFPGVARRLSIIFESPQLTMIDDYAHNPGKIAASIEAVATAFPDHDVFVIFEPHRFSRLDTMYNEFIHSFTKASQVYVTPIYAAGEEPSDRHNSSTIAADIYRASSVDSYPYVNEDQVLNIISHRNHKKVVILNVGEGDSSKIAYSIKRCAIAKQKDTSTKGTSP